MCLRTDNVSIEAYVCVCEKIEKRSETRKRDAIYRQLNTDATEQVENSERKNVVGDLSTFFPWFGRKLDSNQRNSQSKNGREENSE